MGHALTCSFGSGAHSSRCPGNAAALVMKSSISGDTYLCPGHAAHPDGVECASHTGSAYHRARARGYAYAERAAHRGNAYRRGAHGDTHMPNGRPIGGMHIGARAWGYAYGECISPRARMGARICRMGGPGPYGTGICNCACAYLTPASAGSAPAAAVSRSKILMLTPVDAGM